MINSKNGKVPTFFSFMYGEASSANPFSRMFAIKVKKCSLFVSSLMRLTSSDFALFSASYLLFGNNCLFSLKGNGASQQPCSFFNISVSMIFSNCRSSVDLPHLLSSFSVRNKRLSGSQNTVSRLLSLIWKLLRHGG